MITIKAIHEHIRKDYPLRSDAKRIRDMIERGASLGNIWKIFPRLGYGIEYIEIHHKDGEVKYIGYINVGDTYVTTFIRNLNGNIVLWTVGDFVESLPGTWTVI